MPLTFKEALEYATSRRVVLPEDYYGTEQSATRSRAFSIAGVASRDQLQGVLDSLAKVSKEGMTFDQWKAMVKGGDIKLGLPDYRLDNIFRTNMQSAYSVGHWKQQQRNKDRRPYLMYDAINDTRVRPSHLELDNTIRPVDDSFWADHYPPNGYRCRCSVISLTAAQAEARGGETEEPEGGWPAPDKGWDYNPGADPAQGVEQAMEPTQGGSPQMQQAMEVQVEQKQKLAGRPTQSASKDQMVAFFGELDKEAKRQVTKLVKTLGEREWDASVFTTKKLSATVLDSRQLPQGAVGLYRNNTIYAHPGFPKAAETISHEVGHHLSSTLASLGRRDLLAPIYTDMAAATKALDAAGLTETRQSLLKAGDYRKIEQLAKKNKVSLPSGYALTNNQEWLAEMFRLYVNTPQVVELAFPGSFAAFEKIRLEGLTWHV